MNLPQTCFVLFVGLAGLFVPSKPATAQSDLVAEGAQVEKLAGGFIFTEGPANVCFGGKDRKTLFITARTSLYAVKMTVRGGRIASSVNPQ